MAISRTRVSSSMYLTIGRSPKSLAVDAGRSATSMERSGIEKTSSPPSWSRSTPTRANNDSMLSGIGTLEMNRTTSRFKSPPPLSSWAHVTAKRAAARSKIFVSLIKLVSFSKVRVIYVMSSIFAATRTPTSAHLMQAALDIADRRSLGPIFFTKNILFSTTMIKHVLLLLLLRNP